MHYMTIKSTLESEPGNKNFTTQSIGIKKTKNIHHKKYIELCKIIDKIEYFDLKVG